MSAIESRLVEKIHQRFEADEFGSEAAVGPQEVVELQNRVKELRLNAAGCLHVRVSEYASTGRMRVPAKEKAVVTG